MLGLDRLRLILLASPAGRLRHPSELAPQERACKIAKEKPTFPVCVPQFSSLDLTLPSRSRLQSLVRRNADREFIHSGNTSSRAQVLRPRGSDMIVVTAFSNACAQSSGDCP